MLLSFASLYVKTESSVKWDGQISEPFEVHQDDRQGGILSTDLYTLYINQLLNLLETSGNCVESSFCIQEYKME
jgi:hypothetical protein